MVVSFTMYSAGIGGPPARRRGGSGPVAGARRDPLVALRLPLVVGLLGELAELDLGEAVARLVDLRVLRAVADLLLLERLLGRELLEVPADAEDVGRALGVLLLVVDLGLLLLALLGGPLRRGEAGRDVRLRRAAAGARARGGGVGAGSCGSRGRGGEVAGGPGGAWQAGWACARIGATAGAGGADEVPFWNLLTLKLVAARSCCAGFAAGAKAAAEAQSAMTARKVRAMVIDVGEIGKETRLIEKARAIDPSAARARPEFNMGLTFGCLLVKLHSQPRAQDGAAESRTNPGRPYRRRKGGLPVFSLPRAGSCF